MGSSIARNQGIRIIACLGIGVLILCAAPTHVSAQGRSTVHATIPIDGSPIPVARIKASLLRKGQPPRIQDLILERGAAHGEFTGLPEGSWQVLVEVFDPSGQIVLKGTGTADVVGGSVTPVDISLGQTTGGVEVHVRWLSSAGNALHLDGSTAFAEIRESSILSSVDTALTIEAWVKPNQQPYNTVLSKGSMAYLVQVLWGSGLAFLANGVDVDFFGADEYWGRLVKSDILSTSEWSHVTVTYSASSGIKMYVNGHLAHAALSSGVLDASSGAFRVGARDDAVHTEYFSGDMDEVRIWNIERTPAQIAQHMQSRLTGNEPGLIGYWNFDDPPGSVVASDSSPYGNNLVLHGKAAFVPSKAF